MSTAPMPKYGCPMAAIDSRSSKILRYIQARLLKKYDDQKPLRVFHAKTIGLVEGVLTVNKEREDFLRTGLFENDGSYHVWIRFTNGSSDITPDADKTARGMAIKVTNIKGAATGDEGAKWNMQDIILFNNPVFVPGKGKYQLATVKLFIGNGWQKFLSIIYLVFHSFKGIIPFLQSAPIQTPNILEEIYYSATPYAFGEKNAIKWRATPLKTITGIMPQYPKKDFLRDRLISDLLPESKYSVAFDLCVQFQENEETEPIDDCRVLWKTQFYKVATIIIPSQNITSTERKQLDLDMSFCPGTTMKEHEPLGSVNKIRKQIYGRLAEERRNHPSV